MPKFQYQLCEIRNGTLYHYFYSKKENTGWMSSNKATNMLYEEAKQVLNHYRVTEPNRFFFIQAEYEIHYRKVDRNGFILQKGA